MEMELQRQFPGVHWVWGGGISSVYEVHPLIVVKVPKSGQEEREKFRKELEIFKILSQHPPCPSLVQCFYYTTEGIFLEYMRDISLAYKRQFNLTRDPDTRVVTGVGQLEPLALRRSWINDLAQGVSFLSSLNLAYSDLRAENILFGRDTLKLSDFDSTASFGTGFETCPYPYARLLNSSDAEAGQGLPGTAGVLGPRTEQFALGSLFYLIIYGFEVYDDHCLSDDEPYEHGPRVVELLQDMKFPKLDSDPMVDDIIDKCWYNQYRSLTELAAHTETLLSELSSAVLEHKTPSPPAEDRVMCQLWPSLGAQRQNNKTVFGKGILPELGEAWKPAELGFSMEHRHVLPTTTPAD